MSILLNKMYYENTRIYQFKFYIRSYALSIMNYFLCLFVILFEYEKNAINKNKKTHYSRPFINALVVVRLAES